MVEWLPMGAWASQSRGGLEGRQGLDPQKEEGCAAPRGSMAHSALAAVWYPI